MGDHRSGDDVRLPEPVAHDMSRSMQSICNGIVRYGKTLLRYVRLLWHCLWHFLQKCWTVVDVILEQCQRSSHRFTSLRPSHHAYLEGCALPGEEVTKYRRSGRRSEMRFDQFKRVKRMSHRFCHIISQFPSISTCHMPRYATKHALCRTPLGDLPLDLDTLVLWALLSDECATKNQQKYL